MSVGPAGGPVSFERARGGVEPGQQRRRRGRRGRRRAAAAGALAAALRRYTSLNHLAQAARAVLTNHHQIHQMLADLNRVDFRVVREQAAWACSCGSASTAQRLEADFKVG
ncbi:hypothetical protein O3G_MSEX013913 [Manduca sexta]|uniref:RFX1-4/6/8-like BCD domain-containing protein n=1 Tax=Manduca sexta TaxID=7130 RepID=A0A922CXN4_MANSE|nr:hypothetical protein O3G_MSEX013913 [Manduca sexta]